MSAQFKQGQRVRVNGEELVVGRMTDTGLHVFLTDLSDYSICVPVGWCTPVFTVGDKVQGEELDALPDGTVIAQPGKAPMTKRGFRWFHDLLESKGFTASQLTPLAGLVILRLGWGDES